MLQVLADAGHRFAQHHQRWPGDGPNGLVHRRVCRLHGGETLITRQGKYRGHSTSKSCANKLSRKFNLNFEICLVNCCEFYSQLENFWHFEGFKFDLKEN